MLLIVKWSNRGIDIPRYCIVCQKNVTFYVRKDLLAPFVSNFKKGEYEDLFPKLCTKSAHSIRKLSIYGCSMIVKNTFLTLSLSMGIRTRNICR